ncbi:MAG: type II toxin-antitoxin system RelE/ParE family toxin, partial [Magnetococcales bacterium]|nr:type II toxin-antitoxin system RelE/ParE family toxin [Magnetococcales bacterium]
MPMVVFSPQSRQDLLDIGDYIAKDSRASARRFVGKLIEQCQRIAQSPLA